jgi:hypothetical protein
MSHLKKYIDPTLLQLELSSIMRMIALHGLRKTLVMTAISPMEFYRILKTGIRLNFDWEYIDPHGGRFSLKMSRLSRLRTQ